MKSGPLGSRYLEAAASFVTAFLWMTALFGIGSARYGRSVVRHRRTIEWTRVRSLRFGLLKHDRSREPVEAFQAHGLQGEGTQARISCHHLETAARALYITGPAFGVDDLAVARDVIDNNDAART